MFSTLSQATNALVQCQRCHGTGKVTSTTCQNCFGSGIVKANVTKVRASGGGDDLHTTVTGIFRNNEKTEVYVVATAAVKKSQSEVYTNTSAETLLPPNQDTPITITIKDLGFQIYFAFLITLTEIPDITCPACNGTGGGGSLITCPDCNGTGYITESASGGGINFSVVAGPVIAVVGVAVAGGVGFMVFKKKRVTESKIRNLTSSEFENWVIKRLSGTSASILDSRKGINGFAGDGTPLIIKQSDNIGKNVIDTFVSSIMQTRARRGVIVGFSFDKDAYTAITRAKVNYRMDVKVLTVKELLQNKETALLR